MDKFSRIVDLHGWPVDSTRLLISFAFIVPVYSLCHSFLDTLALQYNFLMSPSLFESN
jgi:hypothetical protein